MNLKRLVRTLLILLLLSINIGCDQLSKSIVRHKIGVYDQYSYLHHHVTFQWVENTGAFLSLGDKLTGPLRMILLNILPLLAVVFGLIYILAKPDINRITLVGVIMIIGGGFGNIYDRIVHGSVTDFMHIDFVIFQTGVFNVADMSIMAGMFIILIHSWVRKPEKAAAEETN
jgi:signal peptidase II